MALPTMAPSDIDAIAFACSGVLMPKPIAQETFCFRCNLADTALGGRSDHGDYLHAMGFGGSFHLCLLFIRYIGNNDGADTQFFTFGKKFLISVMEYRIHIRHKCQRNL